VLSPLDHARRMRAAAYVIGALLIMVPLVETVFAALPAHLHEPPWRLLALRHAGHGQRLAGWDHHPPRRPHKAAVAGGALMIEA